MNIRLAITLLLFFTKICPAALQPKCNFGPNLFTSKNDRGRIKGHFVAVSPSKKLPNETASILSSDVFFAYHTENAPYSPSSLVFLLNGKTRTSSLEFLHKDPKADCLTVRPANDDEVDLIKYLIRKQGNFFDPKASKDCKERIEILQKDPQKIEPCLFTPQSVEISKIAGNFVSVFPAHMTSEEAMIYKVNCHPAKAFAYHKKNEFYSVASLVFLLHAHRAHPYSSMRLLGPKYMHLYVQPATTEEVAEIKKLTGERRCFFDPQTRKDCEAEIDALLNNTPKDEESEKRVHAQALKHTLLSVPTSSSSASTSNSSLSSAAIASSKKDETKKH